MNLLEQLTTKLELASDIKSDEDVIKFLEAITETNDEIDNYSDGDLIREFSKTLPDKGSGNYNTYKKITTETLKEMKCELEMIVSDISKYSSSDIDNRLIIPFHYDPNYDRIYYNALLKLIHVEMNRTIKNVEKQINIVVDYC